MDNKVVLFYTLNLYGLTIRPTTVYPVPFNPFPDNTKYDNDEKDNRVYDSSELQEPPKFLGGEQWLADNMHYPPEAKERGVQGKVIVQLTIEKDGSVSNASLLRPINPYLDKEALRVVRMMHKWRPGVNKSGKIVRTTCYFPLTFKFE